MNEIKFRAFVHPYCGGGIPQETYNSLDYSDNYNGDLSEFFGLYNPSYFEIMQFTGHRDKNGKDVFTGDIVKCTKGRNDLIEFQNGSAWLRYRNITLHRFVNELEQTIEVIGNIHENEDLL